MHIKYVIIVCVWRGGGGGAEEGKKEGTKKVNVEIYLSKKKSLCISLPFVNSDVVLQLLLITMTTKN